MLMRTVSWKETNIVFRGRGLDRSQVSVPLIWSTCVDSPLLVTECVYSGVRVVSNTYYTFWETASVLSSNIREKGTKRDYEGCPPRRLVSSDP
jgi:hypothetical protein